MKHKQDAIKHPSQSIIIGIIVCVVLFLSGFVVTYLQFASGHPSKATVIYSTEQISGKHPTFYEQDLLDKSAQTLMDTSLPSIIFLHY